MAKNQVCHVEWNVTDIPRAQRFYEGLFDWKFQAFGDSMVVFGTGTEHIGGLSKADSVAPTNSPTVWIEVDDILAYMKKASALGGSSDGQKSQVPSVGWSGVVKDPDGNIVGLVQFDRK